MKITIKSVNVETGEETVFEREETAQEKEQRLASEKAYKEWQTELETKSAQRQALLNRLGITEEEARILLGGN